MKSRPETVILCNGEFPRRGTVAWNLLVAARRVVCCDGAADAYRRRLRREPIAVVGDGDSLRGNFRCVVRCRDQETNDLEKAAKYCRERGWRSPVVLGAAGGRDDHCLSNVFRALALGLELVTDAGRFYILEGKRVFCINRGDSVSVFATDPATRMKSRGLEWPLDSVRFENLYCATLNRATTSRVTIESDRRAYVYLCHRRMNCQMGK